MALLRTGEPAPAPAPAPGAPVGRGVGWAPEAADVDADEDEALPEVVLGHQGRQVPPDAISTIKNEARARERKRTLIDAYGTADPIEIEKIKASWATTKIEYEQLKTAQQTAETASLSEVERLKLQNNELEKKIVELTGERTELINRTKVDKQDRNITALALKHVDEGGVDYSKYQLTKHIRELPPEQRKRIDDKYLSRWFTKFVADNPRFAKEDVEAKAKAEAAKAAAAKAAAVRAKAKAAAAATAAAGAPVPAAPPAPPAPPAPSAARLPQAPQAPQRPALRQATPLRPPVQQVPTARAVAIQGGSKPGVHNGKTVKPGQPNSMNARELKEYKASIGL